MWYSKKTGPLEGARFVLDTNCRTKPDFAGDRMFRDRPVSFWRSMAGASASPLIKGECRS